MTSLDDVCIGLDGCWLALYDKICFASQTYSALSENMIQNNNSLDGIHGIHEIREIHGIEEIEMEALIYSEDPSEQQQVQIPIETLKYARRLLYLSHLFGQFSEVSWQFCVAMFLAACTQYRSIFLISSYGMAQNIGVFSTSAFLGSWIDKNNRWFVARTLISLENVAVLLGTCCCWLLLSSSSFSNSSGTSQNQNMELNSWWNKIMANVPKSKVAVFALLGIHFFCTIAQILDQAFLVAIERDWVVVLSREAGEEDFPDFLSKTNVTMKQIDLSCKVVAPGVAGLVLSVIKNSQWAVIVMGGINLLSLVVEYSCTAEIYALVPSLSHSKQNSNPRVLMNDPLVMEATSSSCFSCFSCLLGELRVYLEQPVAWGGFALALLYANALSFSDIFTTYLLYRGMKLQIVSVLRGIAAAIGLFGTVIYSYSVQVFSLKMTGCWSISYLGGCLAIALTAVTLVKSDTQATAMLVLSVSASRIGLWVFDIAITQMQQEKIPQDLRGIVGGVQQSLNAFFTLVSFALGLVFSDPQKFHYFTLCSFIFVFLSMVLYIGGIYFPRRSFSLLR